MGISAWIQREQVEAIEYLRTENAALREKLEKKRILLDNDQRRRLAAKGQVLGLKRLRELAGIVTPETILRWHRRLVARKFDYSDRRKPKAGRPAVDLALQNLVLKIARENPTWGYDRIQGALANLGHALSDQAVGNILLENGIEPAPTRKRNRSWETFLKGHWETLAAIDFTTTEVWTLGGLVTMFILVVMDLKSRRIQIAGITAQPDGVWVRNITRSLTDPIDGFLKIIRASWLIAIRSSFRCANSWRKTPLSNRSCCHRDHDKNRWGLSRFCGVIEAKWDCPPRICGF